MESSKNPFFELLELENFTAFEQASFEFVPGVNAIIGENGTGKTHILKLIYVFFLQSNRYPMVSVDSLFEQLFQVPEGYASLIRRGKLKSKQRFLHYGKELIWSEDERVAKPIYIKIETEIKQLEDSGKISIPVFIPAIDMLGHTKGFVSTYDNYAIDFDLTHREIVSLLLSPEKRELDEWAQNLVDQLSKPLGGRVELRGERFYVVNDSGELSVTSVGEGLRKIATLIRLIQTGWLAPGTTLFWDEPETNLNPKLMNEVVDAIVTLSRAGVQVILATHSYVILKELDLRLGTDEARFFSLEPTDSGTKVHSFSNFTELKPNAILDQYASIYERQLNDLKEG